VGVASDVRGALTYESAAFTVYLPHTVDPWPRTTLVVRTDPGAMGAGTMLRRALRDYDPAMPVSEMRTMESQLAGSASQPRFVAALASAFGGVAFLLAAVGLGGLVAHMVRGRRREIAIRLAIGARRRQVVRMLLGRTALLVGAGTVVGLGASVLANRALGSLLYEVSPTDPLIYGAITLLLAAAALAAGALPLRHILRMEPREALQVE
jgi:predicted lysophospholipase L1 biosynthesis ABC-type transport system permease subunit